MTQITKKESYREKRDKLKDRSCHCCGKKETFQWNCKCGFSICQDCMEENIWGMSCNRITWVCPDCGRSNGFGNQ